MLLDVPASLDALLSLLRPCFRQRSFQTFRGLLIGQICQTGQRTVTGMLVGARLSGVWHHARAHRFFGLACWAVDELGLRIAALIVERLCEPGAAVLVAVDDSLLKRRGQRVFGSHWHHDATEFPRFRGHLTACAVEARKDGALMAVTRPARPAPRSDLGIGPIARITGCGGGS
jgi:hypothetical protein